MLYLDTANSFCAKSRKTCKASYRLKNVCFCMVGGTAIEPSRSLKVYLKNNLHFSLFVRLFILLSATTLYVRQTFITGKCVEGCLVRDEVWHPQVGRDCWFGAFIRNVILKIFQIYQCLLSKLHTQSKILKKVLSQVLIISLTCYFLQCMFIQVLYLFL